MSLDIYKGYSELERVKDVLEGEYKVNLLYSKLQTSRLDLDIVI